MVNSAAFEKNIIEHKNARKIFDPDVIKIMNDTRMMMPVDLSFIKKAADLRKIKAVSMDSNFVKKSVELTKRSLACFEGSDAPIYTTAFCPHTLLVGLCVIVKKICYNLLRKFQALWLLY